MMRAVSDTDMAAFWDERAREDAYFFVDDRLQYGSPDTERFWADGERVIDTMFAQVDAPAVQPDHVVLDIGCGLGRLSRALAARAARVVAVDVSSEMLARARELNAQLTNVEWVHGDGQSLPDVEVDVVVSFVVFQHLPDAAIALGYVREIGRVLKPGGWAVLHFSNDPSVHVRKQSLGRRLAVAVGRAPKGQRDPRWRGTAVDLDELRATAQEAGLSVEAVANPGTQFCIVRLSAAAA